MSKKVSKQRFDYVQNRIREIEQAITEPGSRNWVYGTPDFASPAFQEYQQEYVDLMQDSIQYVSTHTYTVGNAPKKYLVTFTYDPKKGNTPEQFKTAVVKQLNRAWDNVKYAFEHEDTNIHCHAIIEYAKTGINKTNFDSHIRKYGNVDVRLISRDNGLEEYISKENPIIEIKK